MRSGFFFGVGAYGMWGVFPVYFTAVAVVGGLELIPWRVIMTVVVLAVTLSVIRTWKKFWVAVKTPRLLGLLSIASLLLYANWLVFALSVMAGNVIETSLGYFINPLVTILIGVVVRKEHLTRLQWWAVGVAAVGVMAVAIGYGRVPWIALCLALSFAGYGAIHKAVGDDIDGLTSLAVETVTSFPVALVQLAFVGAFSGITSFSHGPSIAVLVLLSGVFTVVPLLCFAEAASRLPLSWLGFLQFLTPIMSFLYGYLFIGEDMSVTRWMGFIGVWIALTLLVIDIVRRSRRNPGGEPVGLHTGPIPLD